MRWIKLYTEILMDPKMGRLSDRQHRTCINLFLLAGQQERDGLIGPLSDIAWQLHLSESDLSDDMTVLSGVGIVKEQDGQWYVRQFTQRQERPPSDSPDAVTDRVQRFRARKATDGTPVKRACNESVTPPCNAEKKREEENRLEKTETIPPPLPPQPRADDDPLLERMMQHDIPFSVVVPLVAGKDKLAEAWLNYVDARPTIPNVPATLIKNIKAGRMPPSGKAPPGAPKAPDPAVAAALDKYAKMGVLEHL